ncbi:hypothetical protein [Paratractidigestivibacter sp.]|uniref:hypothetical protein n=1 Tax=Paratractidigestivibacter sp. TaxID=2847316 RepID=UPI002AC94A64|nr:hypothetical protein [Paratractidigestivibacter sp.]
MKNVTKKDYPAYAVVEGAERDIVMLDGKFCFVTPGERDGKARRVTTRQLLWLMGDGNIVFTDESAKPEFFTDLAFVQEQEEVASRCKTTILRVVGACAAGAAVVSGVVLVAQHELLSRVVNNK